METGGARMGLSLVPAMWKQLDAHYQPNLLCLINGLFGFLINRLDKRL